MEKILGIAERLHVVAQSLVLPQGVVCVEVDAGSILQESRDALLGLCSELNVEVPKYLSPDFVPTESFIEAAMRYLALVPILLESRGFKSKRQSNASYLRFRPLEAKHHTAGLQCPICLDPITVADPGVRMNCRAGHIAHQRCAVAWFADPRHTACGAGCLDEAVDDTRREVEAEARVVRRQPGWVWDEAQLQRQRDLRVALGWPLWLGVVSTLSVFCFDMQRLLLEGGDGIQHFSLVLYSLLLCYATLWAAYVMWRRRH